MGPPYHRLKLLSIIFLLIVTQLIKRDEKIPETELIWYIDLRTHMKPKGSISIGHRENGDSIWVE